MTIGERVNERLAEMTPSERRVARTLLAEYPSAGLKSLPMLAQISKVTGPTVLRFVRKLGFDGYTDFQRSFHEEVQERMEGLLSLYNTKVLPPDHRLLEDSLTTFKRGLDKTFTPSVESDFDDVARLLSDPRRRAWFVGGRFSQLLAEYLYALVRMLRGGCMLVGDAPEDRRLDSLEIRRRDVLYLFDYRRYQRDTVEVGRIASQRGATVVVVTDPWLSPAVEFARHVLVTHPDSASPFDSMLGGFALAEALAAEVLALTGDAGRRRLEELEEAHDHPAFAEPTAERKEGRIEWPAKAVIETERRRRSR